MPPRIVIVDGNISSGKSTLIGALMAAGYVCFPEVRARFTARAVHGAGH